MDKEINQSQLSSYLSTF